MKTLTLTACVLALSIGSAFAQTTTFTSDGPFAPAAPIADTNAPQYLIGPQDTLQIFVWRQPDLSVTVPVRPDGRISTPLNEDMSAVGKTPRQLARDIENRLKEFLKDPTVNVIVTHPVSRFSQIQVIGQVKEPHSLAFEEGLTVLQAILDVGGPTDFAALKRVKVVRIEGGVRREIAVNLNAILQKGDMRTNEILKAGDVVVVPESRF